MSKDRVLATDKDDLGISMAHALTATQAAGN